MARLSRLAEQMKMRVAGSGDPEITGITEDSRAVRPGWLFVAVPGLKYDGRDFIGQALAQGAAAVMMTEPDQELPVPRVLASFESLRPAMAGLAALIYGRPTDRLITVGLTGTNGKTTSAYLLEAVLKRAGLNPGVMGTINYRWADQVRPAPNTTPEGPVLSGSLAEMAAAGAKAAVLEVSSHALVLGRVAGLGFEAALFTNLSRDHLDFHQDMEEYYQAKRLLFVKYLKPGGRRAAVNIDDPYGRRLAEELGEAALTFGFDEAADVRGSDLRLGRDGLALTITTPAGTWTQTSPLLAEINAYNLLGVAALGHILHLERRTVREALAESAGAPGRLERVGANPDFLALVDYSHGPDSLAKALKACRELDPRRLLVVFGCGGDRDRGKRPIMGRLAGELADLAVVTSDNPRTEEPWSILLEVEAGLEGLDMAKYEAGELASDWPARGYLMIVDRRAAIREAVRLMEPGDILLIAGKGHEDYQIIGREKRHLDDREEALEALKREGRD